MKTARKEFKFLIPLAMAFMMVALCDMVMIYRLSHIGPFTITVGVFVMPLYYLISDIITEVYGYQRARRIVWIMLLNLFIFALIITLLNLFPIAPGWHHKSDFDYVLGHVLRISIMGGIASTMFGVFLNNIIISKWKIIIKGRWFALRSVMSSAIGELIQNIIGCLVLYIGVLPLHKIFQMILPIYFTQILCDCFWVIPGAFFVSWLKNYEGIDVYDTDVDFNPFKLQVDSELT